MFRTKAEILRGLDPTNPASIQALIDFHRRTFGGFAMTAPTPEPPPVPEPTPDAKPDEPLGEAGIKALQTERDARQQLEQQLKDMKSAQTDQMAKLAEAFGIKSEGAKPDEMVAELQKQMAELKHANLVSDVAREHKITDADDLALLRDITAEDAMRKLAARLKPADDAGSANGNGGKRAPKPDGSQGRGGENSKKGRGEDGLAEARRRWPQPAA